MLFDLVKFYCGYGSKRILCKHKLTRAFFVIFTIYKRFFFSKDEFLLFEICFQMTSLHSLNNSQHKTIYEVTDLAQIFPSNYKSVYVIIFFIYNDYSLYKIQNLFYKGCFTVRQKASMKIHS